MKFTKMHGIGNDYIYVNCFEETVDNPNELSKQLSDRHFGIGSDGLVLICPSDKADIEMKMYNSDGSQAQMCGNASRCVGKYAYERGLTDKKIITMDTLAGIKILNLSVDENNKVEAVKVDMGAPELEPRKIPVDSDKERFVNEPMEYDGKTYNVTCVSVGNPHAVIFMDGIDNMEIEKIGPFFENHPMFPERINTEFVEVIDENTLKMRVWERGSGETLACGTGACAVIVAAVLNGKSKRQATVKLRGGDLEMEWNEEDNHIYKTGTATFVFDGETL